MFSLFELIGEAIDPGEVGGFECGAPEVKRRSSTIVLLHFLLAVGLLAAALIGITFGAWGSWGWLLLWLALLGVYLLAAHYLTPVPAYDNLGWLGGIFDNPFRYSDNLNWLLILLMCLLYPGHLVTVGLRDGYLHATGQLPKPRRKKKRKKLLESLDQDQ
jgi:hypothetical protein